MTRVKVGTWAIEEAELDRQHEVAVRRGQVHLQNEPQVKTVNYDPASHRLIIELKNQVAVHLPCNLLQGLAEASPAEIAQVEIGPRGASLLWENLEVGFSVAGLLAGVFGTQAWMAEIGRKGGQATSEAKAVAARLNGKRGGRPVLQPVA